MKKQAQLPMLEDAPPPMPNLASYDWIVVSTSAGKDSMATLDYVCNLAELAGVLSRVVAVHADLGRVEWQGARELAEQQAARLGIRFIPVWRKQGDLLEHIESMGFFPRSSTRYCTADHKRGQIFTAFTALAAEKRESDLLSQVESRGMWPDPKRRFCTSDHKRAQVDRAYTAPTTIAEKDRPVRILSCIGMRADESPSRAKKLPFTTSKRASNGKRQVDEWLPIHRWTEPEVWARINSSPIADLVHPAYSYGMPRLSCCFCIFAPKDALIIAGHHNPELLAEYVRVEKKIGHRFKLNLSMAEVAEAVAADVKPERVNTWTM